MAAYLTDKCAEIRKWLAIGSEVYPDPVVVGWIRMAEEYLSTMLRVKHMLQIDTSTLVEDRVPLPRDWLEIRLVRLLPSGGICRYQTPDAFFNPEFPNPPESPFLGQEKRYTILGNYLIVGEVTPNPGLQVELTYYQSIPPLTDDNDNWANCLHPTIYTLKILHVASLYAHDDDRSAVWDQEVTRMMEAMNTRHKVDMASGSVLVPVRRKSFG